MDDTNSSATCSYEQVAQQERADKERYFQIATNQTRNVENLREYLVENYEDLGNHADSIAEIFDISLTKSATVTLTVSITAELSNLPMNFTEDSVSDWDFDISMSYSGEGDLDSEDITIENLDVTEGN